MPYVEGRVVHDADSHIMEIPGWFEPWLDPDVRARAEAVPPRPFRVGDLTAEDIEQRHDDPDWRAKLEQNVMGVKGWLAAGAYRKQDRPWALDMMGFSSQLVFTTAALGTVAGIERGDDADLAYGFARAHNRAMLDFCSVDGRLLAVMYLPLMDIERSKSFAGEAIEMGAAALMIPAACPRAHSHTHVELDAVWAQLEEAGVPIVLHVGAVGIPLMDPSYLKNGLPPVPDFHGGDANFTSVSFMAIPYIPMQTLATMILDGVLDRFPNLKIGLMELGASWLPGWMRCLDSAADAFHKNEERLQRMSMKPSEFVQRQIRVSPYPHEQVGWIIRESGPSICMFSSDYPHVEGGRNPLKRFEASLEGCSEEEKDAFYCGNFVDLMGRAMERVPARM